MLHIDSPFHGAVLNHRTGRQDADSLTIEVTGTAPLGAPVEVNGVAATRIGDRFRASVRISQRETDVTARCATVTGETNHTIRVLWDRHSEKRYRFSIDDNIFFLRDLAQKRPASLFDCFYLDILRKLHREYGAKFTVNVFFAAEDGFTLAEMPDTYRGEWADNGDWLRLAFHAYAEFPDRPYQYTSAEKLASDYDLVANEILRFAGEDAYAPATVIHWAMCGAYCLPALRERGTNVLSGFFMRGGSKYDINYLLDDARSEYLGRHHALMDFDSGMLFSHIPLVCNNTSVEDTV
ncbi:MAG: hypothetical protein KAI66_02980, partial [Lentisphaeria bacterium]|nr:hypothetical protein [Lentisphaeria bacterium]